MPDTRTIKPSEVRQIVSDCCNKVAIPREKWLKWTPRVGDGPCILPYGCTQCRCECHGKGIAIPKGPRVCG